MIRIGFWEIIFILIAVFLMVGFNNIPYIARIILNVLKKFRAGLQDGASESDVTKNVTDDREKDPDHGHKSDF